MLNMTESFLGRFARGFDAWLTCHRLIRIDRKHCDASHLITPGETGRALFEVKVARRWRMIAV